MGHTYDQLSMRERCEIDRLYSAGQSLREIARQLGRHASTISREVRRNSVRTKVWIGGYDGERAHALAARRRRWDGRFKLQRQPSLRSDVRRYLAMGWSPQQIAGRLALRDASMQISYESIYRFVYHRSAQKDYWHRLLPQRKNRRGRLKRGGRGSVETIKQRKTLEERPRAAEARCEPGHWEADLMAFSKYGQYVLVLHERVSRCLRVTRLKTKAAAHVASRIASLLARYPANLRCTLTFDNGTEFALHERLGIETYFCDPRAPWQKGGIENAIGRMRRTLPRKTDLANLTPRKLAQLVKAYNETPRLCLNYKTPDEVFKAVALQP